MPSNTAATIYYKSDGCLVAYIYLGNLANTRCEGDENNMSVYVVKNIVYGSREIICDEPLVLSSRLFELTSTDKIAVVGNVTTDAGVPLVYYVFERTENYTSRAARQGLTKAAYA